MDGSNDAPVTVERDGPVATVTMNRPHRRNALSHDMLRALVKAFEEA